MGVVTGASSILPDLLQSHQGLLGAEAALGEALAREGLRIGASVAHQWPLVHDHLQLYARGAGRAGLLVLAGAPDEGSRRTGIPFMGPLDARERLGLDADGAARSPAAPAFWQAVGDAPLEALFGAAILAHANPFDAPDHAAVREAAARHVLRTLETTRPQAVVTVGAAALATLGRALALRDLEDLARAPEASWLARWPEGTRLTAYPRAEVRARPPFRANVVPLPDLAGPLAGPASRALACLMRVAIP